jgi:hypothetical protein
VIVALLRFRQGRYDEAARALSSGLIGFRSDPWITQQSIVVALALVAPIATAAPQSAGRIYDALLEPFAVHAAEGPRLVEAADLSRRLDFASTCGNPIRQLEPYVPWTEFFLRLRHDCYAATHDARLATAQRELADFYAHEPSPLTIAKSRMINHRDTEPQSVSTK